MVLLVLASLWLAGDPFEPRLNGRRDREVVISTWDSWTTNQTVSYTTLDELGAERSVCAMLKLYTGHRPSLESRWGGTLIGLWFNSALGRWPTIDDWVIRSFMPPFELSTEDVRQRVVLSLEHFGPAASNAVPVLVQLLETNAESATIRTLGAIGPAAAPSLPHLRRLASTSDDPWFLYTIADSLRRIEPGSEIATLPGGIGGLSSTNERSRARAAELLALIGPPAAEAIPRLHELGNDEWSMVREAAEHSLAAIATTNTPRDP